MMFLVLTILISVLSSVRSDELTCKDDNGNSVDWWIVYKFPTGVLPSGESGTRYAYITSDDKDKSKFKLSPKDMNDGDNIFFNTVDPIYSNPKKYSSVFYNDQYPGAPLADTRAHAKGVLGNDEKTGFWIIHSIPNFMPTIKEAKHGYKFPESGRINGQTAICLTLARSEIPKVTMQLLLEKVNVYDSKNVKDQSLMRLLHKKYVKGVDIIKSDLKTKNGVEIVHFAKTPSRSQKIDLDLFKQMSSDLDVDLNVQTWKKGSGGLQESECQKDGNVKNIEYMAIKMKDGKETSEWRFTQDHSKWAIGEDDPQTCIGDLNRMHSQHYRGGGMLCMPDPAVWKAFKNVIVEVEPCKRKSKKAEKN